MAINPFEEAMNFVYEWDEDAKKLPIETALQVYKNDFWNKIDAANLDWSLAIAAFDTATHVGVAKTNKWLDDTLKRNKGYRYFLNLRTIHYISNIHKDPALGQFKKEWLNRINDLQKLIEILKHAQE